jgi:Ca2+:H+ antiporter
MAAPPAPWGGPIPRPGLRAPRGALADLAFSLRLILIGAPGSRPWLNVCMLLIPAAILSDALAWPRSGTFLLALLSMLPLAERLGFCTEELSEHVNDTVAGLMNASMGNAPELIIALFALSSGKIDVVKQSLIGSVLSNLLLVLGTSLILGGTKVHLQSFNNVLSPQNASLLLACCLAVFMPTSLVASGLEQRPGAALLVSRVSAVLLLLLYGVYLVFQLRTHSELFEDGEGDGEGAAGGGGGGGGGSGEDRADESSPLTAQAEAGGGAGALAAAGAAAAGAAAPLAAAASGAAAEEEAAGSSDGPPEEEHLTLLGATFGLACMAALVALVSEVLVGAIEDAGQAWGVSAAFVAAMVVPIAGNAAEHTSALIFAYKDRLDLALGICVGSAVQIYAFVLPLLVVVGWAAGRPLSLDFKPFECGLLFFAVLITAFSLMPGKSNYLAGFVHTLAYLMMAGGYLLYSGTCPAGSLEVQGAAGPQCLAANGTSTR